MIDNIDLLCNLEKKIKAWQTDGSLITKQVWKHSLLQSHLQMLFIDKDHKVDGKFQVAQIGKYCKW